VGLKDGLPAVAPREGGARRERGEARHQQPVVEVVLEGVKVAGGREARVEEVGAVLFFWGGWVGVEIERFA
jgi:hypothetical protein